MRPAGSGAGHDVLVRHRHHRDPDVRPAPRSRRRTCRRSRRRPRTRPHRGRCAPRSPAARAGRRPWRTPPPGCCCAIRTPPARAPRRQRVAQPGGVDLAVGRRVGRAEHPVGGHQREQLARLVRRDQLQRQPGALRPRRAGGGSPPAAPARTPAAATPTPPSPGRARPPPAPGTASTECTFIRVSAGSARSWPTRPAEWNVEPLVSSARSTSSTSRLAPLGRGGRRRSPRPPRRRRSRSGHGPAARATTGDLTIFRGRGRPARAATAVAERWPARNRATSRDAPARHHPADGGHPRTVEELPGGLTNRNLKVTNADGTGRRPDLRPRLTSLLGDRPRRRVRQHRRGRDHRGRRPGAALPPGRGPHRGLPAGRTLTDDDLHDPAVLAPGRRRLPAAARGAAVRQRLRHVRRAGALPADRRRARLPAARPATTTFAPAVDRRPRARPRPAA